MPAAADAALRDVRDPAQLAVFFQSFGVPASNFLMLLAALDAAVEADSAAVLACVPDREYFLELFEVQREKGAQNGWKFEALLRGTVAEERMDVSDSATAYNDEVIPVQKFMLPYFSSSLTLGKLPTFIPHCCEDLNSSKVFST